MGRRGLLAAVTAVIACGGFAIAPAAAQEPSPEAPGGEQPATEPVPDEPSTGGKEPHEVAVGMLINDIQQLDLQTKSYAVDLYIWFKWDDPKIDPSRTFELINPFQLWGHIRQYAGVQAETLPNGTQYSSLRVQGQFNADLAIDDYPFDTQELFVALEDKSKDESGLVYVPDTDPIAVSSDVSIPGWEIGDEFFEVESHQYPTDFGDAGTAADTYSRVIGGLEVERPAGTYSLKLLLPILLVVFTAALALSLHPLYVEGRIGIGITALLTLVALQLTSDSGLPDVTNLILLDKFYVLSYVFVVLTMVVVVRNSWVDATGDVATAKRADRRGLALLTVGYLIAAALLFLINLA
jgi:hypothetical protein